MMCGGVEMDARAYERGMAYAVERMREGSWHVDAMVASIRWRFCCPGDIESASDFDRGVIDATLQEVSK